MKRNLLILLGLMMGLMSFAQEHVGYVPITYQDGVKWVYYLVNQPKHDTIPYTIEFKGDTIVNNHNVVGLLSHDIHARKCYMTFSKPVIHPISGQTIFDTEPILVAWGFDWQYKTYVHYTKEYRSKVRRCSLPLDIIDDEYDEDCFHCLGWIGQSLESTNQYWSRMPGLYSDHYYQFDNAEEVEIDGQTRTLYSSNETPSPYSQYFGDKPLQVFMMTGIGWFGRFFGPGEYNLPRSNMSNFLSPFGQLRGNFNTSEWSDHHDDLDNEFTESLFSHQEKDGEVIFKSIWYLGDNSSYVGIDRLQEDKKFSSDNRWYSVTGVSYNSKPTEPGIYIHQGQKVVVK